MRVELFSQPFEEAESPTPLEVNSPLGGLKPLGWNERRRKKKPWPLKRRVYTTPAYRMSLGFFLSFSFSFFSLPFLFFSPPFSLPLFLRFFPSSFSLFSTPGAFNRRGGGTHTSGSPGSHCKLINLLKAFSTEFGFLFHRLFLLAVVGGIGSPKDNQRRLDQGGHFNS